MLGTMPGPHYGVRDAAGGSCGPGVRHDARRGRQRHHHRTHHVLEPHRPGAPHEVGRGQSILQILTHELHKLV